MALDTNGDGEVTFNKFCLMNADLSALQKTTLRERTTKPPLIPSKKDGAASAQAMFDGKPKNRDINGFTKSISELQREYDKKMSKKVNRSLPSDADFSHTYGSKKSDSHNMQSILSNTY